jgi:hypothetical protein
MVDLFQNQNNIFFVFTMEEHPLFRVGKSDNEYVIYFYLNTYFLSQETRGEGG